jgi:glyoxylase-like metal-dependent hydrolase (beta-lactamase superfamily II)
MLAEVAGGVWLVAGTDTNWVLVTEGADVTLVDVGYPRDLPGVLSSLAAIGRTPGDVTAIVLTHAHPDHLGSAERLRRDRGIPVSALDAEAPHCRGEVVEQVSELAVLRSLWRPRVLLWALRAFRAGGRHVERLTAIATFTGGAALDVPGGLVPVPTPGHTSGHCAFHMPGRGVLLAGDAFVTAHATTRAVGPQLLPRMFNHDEAAASASLEKLRTLPADVVVTGHGPAFPGSPAEAVDRIVSGRRSSASRHRR